MQDFTPLHWPPFLCVWVCVLRSLNHSPAKGCTRQLLLRFACRCRLSAVSEPLENFVSVHREGCSELARREMCSKGTVSARDSFVYISEAVLSNHGAAPETTRPENMQCLTVSTIKLSNPLCVCIVKCRDSCPGIRKCRLARLRHLGNLTPPLSKCG